MRIKEEYFSKNCNAGDWVTSLALSPNGELLASGTKGYNIKLWNTSTLKLIHEFKNHNDDVNSISFNRDGTIIASGSKDKTIRLWDIEKKREISYIDVPSSIGSIAFSPDTNILASCFCSYDSIDFWDINKKLLINKFEIGKLIITSNINQICFSPDGKKIAVAADYDLNIFEVSTGKKIHSLKLNNNDSGYIDSISFSPDGKKIATGVYSNRYSNITGERIIIWDIDTGTHLRTIHLENEYGKICISFNTDGRIIASGTNNVNFWNAITGEFLGSIERVLNSQQDYNGVTSILFKNDNEIYYSYSNGIIKAGNIKSIFPEIIIIQPEEESIIQEKIQKLKDYESIFRAVKINNGEAIHIYSYIGKEKNIKIPSTIENLPIVSFGNESFANKSLISVLFHNDIAYIGTHAFENNELTELIITEKINKIDKFAFNNNKLTSLVISEGVASIEEGAFMNNCLKNIVIPSSVKFIGEGAFALNKISNITIGSDVIIGDMAFDQGHGIHLDSSRPFYIDNKFRDVYEKNNRKEGVYIFRLNSWWGPKRKK